MLYIIVLHDGEVKYCGECTLTWYHNSGQAVK